MSIISQREQLQAGTYFILPLLFNPTNIYLDNTDSSLGLSLNFVHSSLSMEQWLDLYRDQKKSEKSSPMCFDSGKTRDR